jgi:uncharacterized membrane protein
VILWYVLLGIRVGLGSLTAIGVFCWFGWLLLLPQLGWALWVGTLVSVIVFTIAAVGEYVADTLPQAPNRTAPLGLGARIAFGALVGALAAHGVFEPIAGGIIFGVVGALIGTYGGFRVRMYWSKALGRDLPVALLESAMALGLAVFACWELHRTLLSIVQTLPNAGM